MLKKIDELHYPSDEDRSVWAAVRADRGSVGTAYHGWLYDLRESEARALRDWLTQTLGDGVHWPRHARDNVRTIDREDRLATETVPLQELAELRTKADRYDYLMTMLDGAGSPAFGELLDAMIANDRRCPS